MAASIGVAALRTRCPQSLLLTREGSAAAAVADVMSVALLPGDGLRGGDEAVELLLRVVDKPRNVTEHDPGHPLQVRPICLLVLHLAHCLARHIMPPQDMAACKYASPQVLLP
jgi:hypothetical protein